MGVLRGFERRLEGAVEGMFARAFRSRLQPIELAKAVKRYCEEHRQVTGDGVVVPNAFQVWVHPDDLERLEAHGSSLQRELATVVRVTARSNDWHLRGTPSFAIEGDDDIILGCLELRGRIHPEGTNDRAPAQPEPVEPEPVERAPVEHDWLEDQSAPAALAASSEPAHTVALPPQPAPPPPPAARDPMEAPPITVEVMDTGQRLTLGPGRHTIGRGDDAALTIDSTTVSRSHAVLLVRKSRWWVFDLGSTNGTSVNGRRASELPLDDGDRVRLGTVELLVRIG